LEGLSRRGVLSMYLILEVVSSQAGSLGPHRWRIVDTCGLNIGRGAGNEWVIADPYISRRAARIDYRDDQFFIENVGHTGIKINGSEPPLPPGRPHPLRDGDRISIDQYEIVVRLAQGDPPTDSTAFDFAPCEPVEGDDAVTAGFRALLDTRSTRDAGYAMGNDGAR